MFVAARGVTVEVGGRGVHTTFLGGRRRTDIVGSDLEAGRVSYLSGEGATTARRLARYSAVTYRDEWPGVDVRYRLGVSQPEQRFVVHAGADPRRIVERAGGVHGLSLTANGDLVLHVAGAGRVVESAPRAFQRAAGRRVTVPARFVLTGRDRYTVRVGRYDTRRRLVIDPSYSTYLGGSGSDVCDLGSNAVPVKTALNASGDMFVATGTSSPNFPTTAGTAGARRNTTGECAISVTELNPAGTALIYSTVIGASDEAGTQFNDVPAGIAVDSTGDVYVDGEDQGKFPTTTGAYQTTNNPNGPGSFLFKLSPGGAKLDFSTLLHGSATDIANGLAVDPTGHAFVVGDTYSSDFPTTAGAVDTGLGDAPSGFVTEFNTTGTGLVYSTYVADSTLTEAVAVNADDDAFITGTAFAAYPTTAGAYQSAGLGNNDAYVTELNPTGTARVYSTLLSGSDEDDGEGIAVDSHGDAYVEGLTVSDNYPTTAGSFQPKNKQRAGFGSFVTKLNATGTGLVYSTYLTANERIDPFSGIAVNSSGDAYVTGDTNATNFPTTSHAVQSKNAGFADLYLTEFNAAGSGLIYSTLLGGSNADYGGNVALDAAGDIAIVGDSQSTNFPTSYGVDQPNLAKPANPGTPNPNDLVVVKFSPSGQIVGQPRPKITVSAPGKVRHGKVALRLSCDRAHCSGVVTLRYGKSRKAGSSSYSIAPGKHRTVTVKLSTTARKAVSHAGKKGLKAALTATVKGGATLKRTIKLKI
jgi:Beta-propeller repeat